MSHPTTCKELYILEMPDHSPAEFTAGETINECWDNSFELVGEYFKQQGFKYRGKWEYDFRKIFWKKRGRSLNCAIHNGFKIMKYRLVRIPEKGSP